MIIYGSSMSPFVRKALAFASEKGIDIEIRPSGFPSHTPEFCDASPFRKMPALSDGEFTLPDSTAICHYLEAKQPEPQLIPVEPEQRGRAMWFDEFADTILAPCGAKMFFNRIVSPRLIGRPGDEASADKAEREELPPILDYLEKVAPHDGGYLVGDRLTLADIAVASPFANFRHLALPLDRWPRTLAYVDRILARPSFKQWVDREVAFFAKTAA